jgi:hypothetical protein
MAVVAKDLASKAAKVFARAKWGEVTVSDAIPVYALDSDATNAYLFSVSRSAGVDPNESASLLAQVQEALRLNPDLLPHRYCRSPVDEGRLKAREKARELMLRLEDFGTVVISGDDSQHPLVMAYDGLSFALVGAAVVREVQKGKIQTDGIPKIRRGIGVGHFFGEFNLRNGRKVVLSLFDGQTRSEKALENAQKAQQKTQRLLSQEQLRMTADQRAEAERDLMLRMSAKAKLWEVIRRLDETHVKSICPAYLGSASPASTMSRGSTTSAASSGGSSRLIDGVPDLDWRRGCAPTAAGNILAYWDGQGYGRLVDDPQKTAYDTIDELAVAMHTDSSGSTDDDHVDDGVRDVCNSVNSYAFTADGPDSWYVWGKITDAIDHGRPAQLLLHGHHTYGEHSVTVVGYRNVVRDCAPDDHYVTIHDTWSPAGNVEIPYEGSVFSFDMNWRVVRVTPGGSRDEGVNYVFVGNISGFATGWTHIVGAVGGGLLFYNASTGDGASARLDAAGNYGFVGNIPGFARGWTHIVAANVGSLLFYNATNGAGATARLDSAGRYTFVGNISGFATGWTHIVGARDGGLLFYNASTGNGAIAMLDAAGNYAFIGNIPGFATGWTHIVAANVGSLLFYNASNGAGATARL